MARSKKTIDVTDGETTVNLSDGSQVTFTVEDERVLYKAPTTSGEVYLYTIHDPEMQKLPSDELRKARIEYTMQRLVEDFESQLPSED